MHRHDRKLWFKMKACCPQKHFLCGNAHTFRGRMSAYCPRLKHGFTVSLNEMDDLSKEARYWVKGFLCGNQPPRPVDREGDLLPPSHPANKKWERLVARFLASGSWPKAR